MPPASITPSPSASHTASGAASTRSSASSCWPVALADPAAPLHLRPATVDDDTDLRALFRTCFPASPKIDADHLRWQYWQNPFAAVRSWVVDDGGVVAHYAALPVPLVIAGVPCVGGVGVDAATAPSHRGRGLFERLARAVYEDCHASGLPAVLCYPNEQSLRGFVKAGGTPLGRLDTFVLPVDAAFVADRFRLPTGVARLAVRSAFRARRADTATEVTERAEPPDELDALWDVVAERRPYGVRRDASWWRWRYRQHPTVRYRYVAAQRAGRLVGAAAVRAHEAFGGRFLYLLELLAVDGAAAAAMVAHLTAHAEGAAGLVTVARSGSELEGLAQAAGLRRLPRRLEPKPFNLGVAVHDPLLADAPWAPGWGDLDHL